MIRRWLAVGALVASCGGGEPARDPLPPPVAPSDASVARAGLVITAQEVRLAGAPLGVLPDEVRTDRVKFVDALRRHAARPTALAFTADASAETVLAALGALDELGPAGITLAELEGERTAFACDTRPAGDGSDAQGRLSLALTTSRWFVAAHAEDVKLIDPPYGSLDETLRADRALPRFARRDDLEIAADPGLTGAQLTIALRAACAAGFVALHPTASSELTMAMFSDADRAPAAAPPQVSHDPLGVDGPPAVVGELGPALVRRYLKRRMEPLDACYTAQLAKQPRLAGTVVARFTIGAGGAVTESSATGVDPAVGTCIAGVIQAIAFPAPKTGTVQVTYPLTYAPTARGSASPRPE